MAITGPLIVMSGLTILSIIISQLHKLVALFEKKDIQATEPADGSKDEISIPKVLPIDISETAAIYQQLIDRLEQPFELKDLYRVAEENNFPHPVLTVSRFREAGILKQAGEGVFIWNE